jgi:hypothetical protein
MLMSNSAPALEQFAEQIRALDKNQTKDALEIGGLLIAAKEVASDWSGFLDREVYYSQRTADRYMAARRWYDTQPGEIRHRV